MEFPIDDVRWGTPGLSPHWCECPRCSHFGLGMDVRSPKHPEQGQFLCTMCDLRGHWYLCGDDQHDGVLLTLDDDQWMPPSPSDYENPTWH